MLRRTSKRDREFVDKVRRTAFVRWRRRFLVDMMVCIGRGVLKLHFSNSFLIRYPVEVTENTLVLDYTPVMGEPCHLDVQANL